MTAKRTMWTEALIRDISEGLVSRYELKKANSCAYRRARKIPGLLEELFGEPLTKPWTVADIEALTDVYPTRNALYAGNSGAYRAARQMGLIHLFPRTLMKWDEESVRVAAGECNTIIELQEVFYGAWKWAWKAGILRELFPEALTEWSEEAIIAECGKYKSRAEFAEGSSGAYKSALRRGLVGVIDELLPSTKRSWASEADVREEASKYTTKVAFMRGTPGAYTAATRAGILNDLGFDQGLYGYKSHLPGYVYIADIRLLDNTDGILIGITGKKNGKRYRAVDMEHISNGTLYRYQNGEDALRIEGVLKRLYLDRRVRSGQCPLSEKLGTSGEVLTGIPRSLVETSLLNEGPNYEWSEPWGVTHNS